MSKSEKKNSYVWYALGEIILIVIGILIAVQIDDYYNEVQREQLEKKYYNEIVTDLQKDSVHFQELNNSFKNYLERYYQIYERIKGTRDKIDPVAYDFTLYNRAFTPVTLNNHQNSLEIIYNSEIRGRVNEYFASQMHTHDALIEFNNIIREQSRPYFMLQGDFIEIDSIFFDNVYGFLPRGSVLNTEKLERAFLNPKPQQILAYLRISGGYALSEVNKLIRQNHELIELLNEAAGE